MRRNWIKIVVAVGLILLPIVFWWFRTAVPREITFAMGPQYGLYTTIMEGLKEEIEEELGDRYGIEVNVVPTEGSVENLRLLKEGVADFALYQAGTERFFGGTAGIFELLDEDHDSALSSAELKKTRKHSVGFALDVLDEDRDGKLSPGEFSNVPGEVRFVANTHADVAHLVVRPEIEDVHELIEGEYRVSSH